MFDSARYSVLASEMKIRKGFTMRPARGERPAFAACSVRPQRPGQFPVSHSANTCSSALPIDPIRSAAEKHSGIW
jgi:hypothetical protein